MILFVDVDLKQVSLFGKKFPWQKPPVCPRCQKNHVWGHGFTATFFDGFLSALLMRRLRCPGCGCVIKYRPKSHFSRFQTAISTIKSQLTSRIETRRWSANPGRGRHWLQVLKRQSLARLGLAWQNRLIEAFDRLCALGIVPVSRSF